MKGADQLLALRRARRRPAGGVWVECGPVYSPPAELDGSRVQIGQAEDPALCDLRCVVGLSVHIDGEGEERVRGAYRSVVRGGAALVVACVLTDGEVSAMWGTDGRIEWRM